MTQAALPPPPIAIWGTVQSQAHDREEPPRGAILRSLVLAVISNVYEGERSRGSPDCVQSRKS